MARIAQYPTTGVPTLADKVIGTSVSNQDETVNFTLADILSLPLPSVPVYANNAAALLAGLVAGNVYRITGTDYLGVVH
jgi:hypothetical protein|tara:strand:- start:8452 stop:8688 length:237 start_codon:yes stop_codon:yes gene_type:complete